MKTYTYYIVPSWTNIAGQCRIVVFPALVNCPSKSYKKTPHLWTEVGLVNARGKLVCIDAPQHVIDEFRESEPLCAGLFAHIEMKELVTL